MKILVFVLFIIHFSFTYAQNELIINDFNGNIYKINIQNCTQTLICNTDVFTDIAINPLNDNLYGLDAFGGIYLINVNTGSTTLVYNTELILTTSLTCDKNGVFYIATSSQLLNNGAIFSFDLNIPGIQPVSILPQGLGASGDLSFFQNKLIVSTTNDHLFTIEKNQINSYEDLGAFANISDVFGIVTLYQNCEQKLIASAGTQLYIVNPETMTTTPLCPTIQSSIISGAATITETIDSPEIIPVSPLCITQDPVQLSANITGGIWEANCNTCISADGIFIPQNTEIGSYTITYSVCDSIATTEIEINEGPDPSFNYPLSNYCINQLTVEPEFIATMGGTFHSSSNLQINSQSGIITIDNSNIGIYEINYIIDSGNGCIKTHSENITITNNPEVQLLFPDYSCISNQNLSFSFESSASSVSNLMWNFGTSANIQSSSDSLIENIIYNQSGNHNFSLSGTFDGCPISINDQITIVAEPEINFDLHDGLQCAPFIANFINNSSYNSDATYLWEFGDGQTSTEQNPSHLYENVGIYNVSLTMITSSGCIDTLKMTQNDLINTKPRPTANFSLSPKTTDICHANIQFSNLSIGANEYLFVFDDNNSISTEINPNYNYQSYGTINPQLIATNQFGCSDTAYQTLIVEPHSIFIPNSFTPDNDKYNNSFKAESEFPTQSWNILIYNKWGELIFQSNDQNFEWDGTYENQPCPQGTYCYIIEYETCEQTTERFVTEKGHVSLIR